MVTPINCSKIKETVYGEEGPFDNKNKQHLLVSKIQNMGKTIRKMLLALLMRFNKKKMDGLTLKNPQN